MLGKILEAALLLLIGAACYLIFYTTFAKVLCDDWEFGHGKSAVKKRSKKKLTFWQRFLFLDFRPKVKKWHYALFVFYLISFPVFWLLSCGCLLMGDPRLPGWVQWLAAPWIGSVVVASCVRWRLYAWNMVRPRKPRKKWK